MQGVRQDIHGWRAFRRASRTSSLLDGMPACVKVSLWRKKSRVDRSGRGLSGRADRRRGKRNADEQKHVSCSHNWGVKQQQRRSGLVRKSHWRWSGNWKATREPQRQARILLAVFVTGRRNCPSSGSALHDYQAGSDGPGYLVPGKASRSGIQNRSVMAAGMDETNESNERSWRSKAAIKLATTYVLTIS